MPSLPELYNEQTRLFDCILRAEGEITPEIEEKLEALLAQLSHKVDACQFIREKLNLEASYWKNEAKRLIAVAKSLENAEERLSLRLKGYLEAGMKLEGEQIEYYLSDAEPAVDVLDEMKVPERYFEKKISLTLDKTKAKTDLKNGLQIEGLSLRPVKALRTRRLKGKIK